jgi:transcriptional regulator with XRE-family HTH domain
MKATALNPHRRRVVQVDGPDPIDTHVGRRLYEQRLLEGLSQAELGRRIGVSFQAVQKYESARMRISASTLYRLCQALSVPPGYFFEGYAPETAQAERSARRNPKGRASQTGLTNVSAD